MNEHVISFSLSDDEVLYLQHILSKEIWGSDDSENGKYWEETTDASHHVQVATTIAQKLKGLPF